LCLLTLPNQAISGAWLQKENGGVFLHQFRVYHTEEYYDKDGDKYSDFSFLKSEYNPYGEYGLYDWLTVGGSVNAQAIRNQDTLQNDSTDIYLNNLEVFVRSELFSEGKFTSSIEPRIYIPIRSSLSINPDGERPQPQLKLNLGYNLADSDYLDFSINYIRRDDADLKDMLKTELSWDCYLNDEFSVLSQVSSETSMGRVGGGNYDLTKLQISGIWDKYNRKSYQLGVSYDIDGKNTGSGVGINYSVGYKF